MPVCLGVLAAFGTIFGHVLGYMLVVPDAHARAELLAATGHSHWNVPVAVAIGALVMGVAGYIRRHIQRSQRAVPWWSIAMRLVAFQVPAFLMLETLERALATGGHADDVRIIAVGLLAQLVVAALTATCLSLLARVVDHLVRHTDAPASPCAIYIGLEDGWRPIRRFVGGGRTSRGPPGIRLVV